MTQDDDEILALRDRLRHLESRLVHAESALMEVRSPLQRLFMIKRTTGKQWQEQVIVDGAVAEFADGRKCDAVGNAELMIPAGVEWVMEVRDANGHRYMPLGSVYFPVSLSQDGGSNGTATTPATYTYTVSREGTGIPIATSVSPAKSRKNGTRTVASMGMAYYNAQGALVLYDTSEREGTGGCT